MHKCTKISQILFHHKLGFKYETRYGAILPSLYSLGTRKLLIIKQSKHTRI